MFRQIRKAAKSWVLILLMGVIALSFIAFGVGDNMLRPVLGNAVVRAGERQIDGPQFQTIVTNYRRALEQQAQRPVTLEEMARFGVIEQVVRALSAEESFYEVLRRAGVTPADEVVGQQLREQRAFFDPVTGRFSPQQYQRLLAENEITVAQFEATLRDEAAQSHFTTALVAGLRAPRLYGAAAAATAGQTRTVSWFAITPSAADQPAAPTDAQLTAFIRENAEQLRRPEFRALTVVRFIPAEVAPTVQISEAEVVRQFNFRRDSLSTPERRSFVQIPVRDAAAGARVVAALRAGGDPAAVARSISAEPVAYDLQPRTAVIDPAVAASAFALANNGVSDVIRGELGQSVVKVTAITPAAVATLDSVRPQIEGALRERAANERVQQTMERYEQAHTGGASLAEAARAAGVPALSTPPVSATGQDQNAQPTQFPQPLLQAAFELPPGGESDLIQLGAGQYAAIRVDRIIPPALPPLESVRTPLTQAWTARQLAQRVEARANAAAARVRDRQPIAQVAQSAGSALTTAPLTLQTAIQALGQDAAQRLFSARSGETVIAAAPQAYYVARIDRVANPPAVEAAAQVEPARQALRLQILQEMGELSRRWALQTVEPSTDVARARQAVGLAAEGDDAATPASGGATPPPPARP